MKRLLALLLLVLLLTGCSGGTPNTTEPAAEDATTAPTLADTQPAPEQMPNAYTGLGGKMPELTVTCADGRTLRISELLKEKKLIVLNFWYEDCPWCMREFPVMEVTYQKYKENVEILALNPADGAEKVEAFREKHGMSIPMAACNSLLPRNCGVTAYPTSIFIDRYGVVSLIHVGAITAGGIWETVFDTFTAEDYSQSIYTDIQEIIG